MVVLRHIVSDKIQMLGILDDYRKVWWLLQSTSTNLSIETHWEAVVTLNAIGKLVVSQFGLFSKANFSFQPKSLVCLFLLHRLNMYAWCTMAKTLFNFNGRRGFRLDQV